MRLSAPFICIALLVFVRLAPSVRRALLVFARRALSARPSAAAPAAVDRRVRPREHRALSTGWRSRRASGMHKKPV
jgi:hypothetical protein